MSSRQPTAGGRPLVNCHTHLELSWATHLCPKPPGESLPDWIFRLVQANRDLHDSGKFEKTVVAAVEAGIQQLLAAGTTHVGDITATGLSIEPLLDSGLAGVVYVEVLGLEEARAEESWQQARQLLEKHRPHERNGLRLGLSRHSGDSARTQPEFPGLPGVVRRAGNEATINPY